MKGLLNGERTQRYVNLMMDSGFKAVFADKSNKKLLVGLLNHVLTASVHVRDIVRYGDRERDADRDGGKKTILDLICVDDEGRTFSVEVQRRDEEAFFERCVYYACGLYHISLDSGKHFDALRPVHLTAITSFKCPHEDERLWDTDDIVSRYRLSEERTGELGRPTIFVNFVELGRFTKTAKECETERDWLFFWFKHGWEQDEAPETNGDQPFLKSLVEACEIAEFPLDKRREYDKDMLTELDIIAQREFAVKEAEVKAKAEGKAEGIAEGVLSVARNMIKAGMESSTIRSLTGLDEREIMNLTRE